MNDDLPHNVAIVFEQTVIKRNCPKVIIINI